LVVILRSPANVGTTKNLEILRGVYLELAERLRMTSEGAISGWPIKFGVTRLWRTDLPWTSGLAQRCFFTTLGR